MLDDIGGWTIAGLLTLGGLAFLVCLVGMAIIIAKDAITEIKNGL